MLEKLQLSKGSRTIVDMLRYLNNQDNIPRKEKKFMNYLKIVIVNQYKVNLKSMILFIKFIMKIIQKQIIIIIQMLKNRR